MDDTFTFVWADGRRFERRLPVGYVLDYVKVPRMTRWEGKIITDVVYFRRRLDGTYQEAETEVISVEADK